MKEKMLPTMKKDCQSRCSLFLSVRILVHIERSFRHYHSYKNIKRKIKIKPINIFIELLHTESNFVMCIISVSGNRVVSNREKS